MTVTIIQFNHSLSPSPLILTLSLSLPLLFFSYSFFLLRTQLSVTSLAVVERSLAGRTYVRYFEATASMFSSASLTLTFSFFIDHISHRFASFFKDHEYCSLRRKARVSLLLLCPIRRIFSFIRLNLFISESQK